MTKPPIPLDPFELTSLIATGGMGEVWRGSHLAQAMPVAVKVVRAARARQRKVHTSIRNEARAVARLHHRNIILLLDVGQVTDEAAEASGASLTPGSPYFAMELLTGGTLENDKTPLAWPKLREVLLEILDALAHAHARGVLHRDLKPSNVLLAGATDLRPGIKLSDFGVARALEILDDGRFDGRVSGTPRYMAPEQIAGSWRDEGPWTDLYAVGLIASRCATGRAPFHDQSGDALRSSHLNVPLPRIAPESGYPVGFADWVCRLTSKRPSNRFERAADARLALLAIANSAVGPTATATATERSRMIIADDDAVGGDILTQPQITDFETPAPSKGRGLRSWELNEDLVARAEIPALPASWRRPAPTVPSMQLVGAGLGLFGLRPIPIAGREHERDHMWRTLRDASLRGRASALFLHGAAGCGKSRLVEWTTQRAHECGGATILRATHSPIAGAVDGIARMVGSAIRVNGLPRDQMLARIERFFIDNEDAAEPTPPASERLRARCEALAEFVAPQGSEATVRFSSPAERYRVALDLLRLVARRRALLLWLDDIHHAADTIRFVDYLLTEQEHHPATIVVMATLRDDVQAVEQVVELCRVHPNTATMLPIAALDTEDHKVLVERMLGLSSELAARVAQRTDGNPLFAVQLIGDWVQRRILEVTPMGFALRKGASDRIPDDIHAVWRERLESLLDQVGGEAREARMAIEIAAALGNDVPSAEWQRACELAAVTPPTDLVERLLSSRLIVGGEDGWSFGHGMLRESIERTARGEARWSHHHLICAEMLASYYRAADPQVAARRGRHLFAAGQYELALGPLLDGAEERRLKSEFAAAEELFALRHRALVSLGQVGADPRWGDGCVRRARAFVAAGNLAGAEEVLAPVGPAAASHGWARVAAAAANVEGVLAHSRGDSDTAKKHLESAVARYRSIDDPAGLADALTSLGRTAMWRRELETASALYEEAYEISRHHSDLYELGLILRGLANVRQCAGELDRATELLERALSCFRHNGNRYEVASCVNDLGEVSRARGDLGAAERAYREAAEIFEAIGAPDSSTPYFNLGLMMLHRDAFGEAEALFAAQVKLLDHAKRTIDLLWLHAGLAVCAAAGHRGPAFDQHFDKVADLRRGFVDEDIPWCAERAAALWLPADRVRARRALELAHHHWELLDRPDRTAELEQALERLGEVTT